MMKKIIALALALSMALSMVAFAGYTDAALINEDLTADVDLVKALGLMTGNPDGSFNPQGTLTRGEAAVIIYRLKSGKTDIDASWGDASLNTFTDMAGHWSAPYVNYCAALGLITGNPDGTFRPDNAVTGVEMAKMLLNVAGYDTEKQQYGPKWPAAVLADAGDSGLLNGYEAAFTAPAPRQWVAAMVANLLDVQTVSYNAYTNALVKNTKDDEPVLFGEQYGVKSVKGFAMANEFTSIASGTAGAADEDTSIVRTEDGKIEIDYVIDTEMLGHDVKVYYKGASLKTASKIYAVMDNAKTVIVTTADKVELDEDEVLVDGEVVGDGVEYKTVGEDQVPANVYEWESLMAADASFIDTRDSREVVVVENDGRWDIFTTETAYTQISDLDAEKNKIITADKTLNLVGGTEESNVKAFKKVAFLNEVAEDDYVVVETLADGSYTVAKLNPVRTKISSTKLNTSSVWSFVAGGTTYNGAKLPLYTAPATAFSFNTVVKGMTETTLKETTYDVYTDGKYVVFMDDVDAAVVSGLNMNVAILLDTNSAYVDAGNTWAEENTAKVQVMFADGAIAIYEYVAPTSTSAAKVAFSALAVDTIYEYTMNDDGTIYFPRKPVATKNADNEDVAGVSFNAATGYAAGATVAKSALTVDSKLLYANEDSFFFVKQTYTDDAGETVKKYSIVKASEIEQAAQFGSSYGWTFAIDGKSAVAYTIDETTGLNTLVYGVLNGTVEDMPAADGSAKGTEYFIATSNVTTITDETGTVYQITGINAEGKKVTLNLTSKELNNVVDNPATDADETATNADVARGKMYTVKSGDDTLYLANYEGTIKTTFDATTAGWYQTTIKASTGSSVMLGATNSALLDLADDCVITVVTKGTSSSSSSMNLGSLDGNLPFDKETSNNVWVELEKVGDEMVVSTVILAKQYVDGEMVQRSINTIVTPVVPAV